MLLISVGLILLGLTLMVNPYAFSKYKSDEQNIDDFSSDISAILKLRLIGGAFILVSVYIIYGAYIK